MAGDELDAEALDIAKSAYLSEMGGTKVNHMALVAALRAYLRHAQPERKGAEAMRERAAHVLFLARTGDQDTDLRSISSAIRALPLPGDKEPT
jgi:hypothetical protein